jgi:hypothetical protein
MIKSETQAVILSGRDAFDDTNVRKSHPGASMTVVAACSREHGSLSSYVASTHFHPVLRGYVARPANRAAHAVRPRVRWQAAAESAINDAPSPAICPRISTPEARIVATCSAPWREIHRHAS